MENNKTRYKEVIFTQKLALYLMYKGFVLLNIEKRNKNNSTMNVFIFNNSEELQSSIKEYKNNINDGKQLKIIF